MARNATHTPSDQRAIHGAPTREVTTPDGVTHAVPAGITYNRASHCWTVAFRQRFIGTKSFGGPDTRASLAKATLELDRRRRRAAADGWVPHLDSQERRGKRQLWGRPGVRLEMRRYPRFTAIIIRQRRKYALAFTIDAHGSDTGLLSAWKQAVAARDLLVSAAARGSWPPNLTRLRRESIAAASMLDVDAVHATAILRQIHRTLRGRTDGVAP